MAIENRSIRIEDWQGNVYYPETLLNTSTAGTVTDSSAASSDPEATTYTDGTLVSDSTANGGKAIVLQAGSSRSTLFRTQISNVLFGNISIGMRLKSSIGSGSSNILEVNTYFVDASGETPVETLIQTSYVDGNAFEVPNEYRTIGITSPFKGIATGSTYLKIEIIMLPETGAIMYFDQIAIGMEMTASASPTKVEGSTIIFS